MLGAHHQRRSGQVAIMNNLTGVKRVSRHLQTGSQLSGARAMLDPRKEPSAGQEGSGVLAIRAACGGHQH